MEILPHFWISDVNKNLDFLKNKKITLIIFLSKNNKFIKYYNDEQIRIPIDNLDNHDDKNNIVYQHLFDVVDCIHENINKNKNILLIGNENDDQILDVFILAYFIKYGKTNLEYAIYFLKSKKKFCLMPVFYYEGCLLKYYKQIKALRN